MIPRETTIEVVIKEHRRWARWIKGRRNLGEGNLTLTNRRLLFLHRIPPGPDVAANIKRLADAPVETVLDYAYSLDKKNFQIPLSSVTKAEIGSYVRFPLPHFYLAVFYLEGKKRIPHTVAFQFRRPILQVLYRPQIIEVWKWVRAINKTIREKPANP